MKRFLTGGLLALGLLAIAGTSSASPVGLGTAKTFAVLSGQAVTNTGFTEISGDVGVSPGTAVTGFPPGTVTNGTIHRADGVADQAQADLTTAYDDAAGRPATATVTELGGQTLAPGVYKATSELSLTGTVTLDGQNDPDSVFVFQAGSTLITASSSTVALVRGANVCNVFWQVGSSATFGTDSTFIGTVMALTSATVQTRATVQGRVLARNGQVSLDDNTIIRPDCESGTTTPTTSTPTTQPGDTGNGDGNGTGNGGDNGTGNGTGNGSTTSTRPDASDTPEGPVLIPPAVDLYPPAVPHNDDSPLPVTK